MTPRWESLQSTAEQPAIQGGGERPSPPRRVSALRSAGTQDPPPAPGEDDHSGDSEEDLLEGEARKTPAWLLALQILVLVLVIAVLGVLVYLYATGDLFGEEDAGVVAVGYLTGWMTTR